MVGLIYDNNKQVKLKAIDFFIENFKRFPEIKKSIFAETVISDIITNSDYEIKKLVIFKTFKLLKILDKYIN